MNQASPKALVLVVEDNDDVRNIITIYLRRNGYSVSEAANGVDALEALGNLKPDAILLDVLLPKLDGMEVLKRLREADATKSIPVVMMSAVLQTRDLKSETVRLNVSSFLQKPFQMRTLLEHVEHALNATRGDRQTGSPSGAHSTIQSQSTWRAEKRLQMVRQTIPSTGKLSDLPVPEILHSIFVESRTGRLRLNSRTTEKRVFFMSGMPVFAESSVPEETLGAHLIRRGKVSQEQHDLAVSEMTRTGRHFGEVLLKLDLLGPHELFTELEDHLTEKVISTMAWHEGTYEYIDGDSWKDDVIVARMKPGRIMLDGVQQFWTPTAVQRRLRITDLSRTFPLDSSPYSEDQLGLTQQETRILQMVRRGLQVGDIVRQIRDLNAVTSILYALFVMEYLGFVLSTKREVKSTARPTNSQAPANTQETKDEYARVLLAEYIKFRTADYFKLLGIARGASDEEITEAFEKRKKRYHPDTLIGIDTGLVHEKIEELYVRIHNAYRTLINPETKKQYKEQLDRSLEGAPISSRSKTGRHSIIPEKDEDVLLFEDGFTLLRNGSYQAAMDLFRKAADLNPKAKYMAYEAWAGYLMNPERRKKKAEQLLVKLLKENRDDPLFPYLLGNMALKEKDNKRAAQLFERAVRIDPQHIDSARQLRILRMRQQSSEVSGLFDLFKKK